ncbi:hypothetical protein, partial [Candidatus Vampirococcus lugosii]|uniref:hypothetical protein n=1 Tax=Candidatus Vampirococcus lugosii TaxID=2789015 RepID=UPI001BCB6F24
NLCSTQIYFYFLANPCLNQGFRNFVLQRGALSFLIIFIEYCEIKLSSFTLDIFFANLFLL